MSDSPSHAADSDPGSIPTRTFAPEKAALPPIQIEGYRVIREISRGGQGTVFEGVRLSTGRRVAIKILSGGALSNPRDRARFDQEARSWAHWTIRESCRSSTAAPPPMARCIW